MQHSSKALPARMVPSVLTRMRCPQCREPIVSKGASLSCPGGHELYRRDGYVDASSGVDDPITARTFESFGYEWNAFDELRPEDEAFWREYFADVELAELSGCVGLDAGCGKGRYSRFTASHLDALVALDGSDAVTAAARNLAGLPNVVVVRADIRKVPFADQSFDFISCLGVLHHLADPRDGFRALVRLLAPGGILLLYLYSRPSGPGLRALGLQAATMMRKLTVRFPYRLLRVFSGVVAGALYAAVVVPGRIGGAAGVSRLARLPLAAYRGRPLHALWLDTFDRLSAPMEKRYLWADVEEWFREAELEVDAVSEERGLTIVGRRPPAGGGP